MKTILSAVFFILLITNSLQSQFLPEWVKMFYTAADSTVADPFTVMDSDNNIYSTFAVRHLNFSFYNIVTLKSNSSGDLIWSQHYYEQSNNLNIRYPRAISLDGAGNVYVFCTLTDTTRTEFKVIKYSSTGTQLWAYTYSLSSNHYSFVTDGITDNNGNSYFTGYSKDVWSSEDTTYLFKIDNAGNLNWVKKNISNFFNFIYNIGSPKVALDAQNNVIHTTFKAQNFLSDILTQKYDPAGNMLWSKEYDNNGLWDYPFAIKTDNANNVFITGVAGSNLHIDSGYTLLLKYNSAGVQQYAATHRLNGIPDYGYKLKIDNSSGQIYVLSRNRGDFNSILNDLILKKFDANGVLVWANKYGNTNNIYEIGNSLDLDNSGNPIIAGNHHYRGQSKILLLKYDKSNGNIAWDFPYNYNDNEPYGTTDLIIRNNHLFVTGSIGYSLLNMKLTPSQQNSVSITRSVSKPILDLQSTFDTISFSPDMLPPDAYITDVNVTLDSILHPFVGDLEISLIHSQYKDTLVYRRGFSGDNFIGTILDDTAVSPICNSNAAPFTGYFKPCRALSQFNSLLTEGPWILQIYDRKSSDTGLLKAWSLTITYQTLIGLTQISHNVPGTFLLEQNYPNPFNPNTRIKFSVPKSSFVKLAVYDMLGKELKTVVDNFLSAGVYESDLDMSSYSSGVYFYRIETNEFTDTKKMVLLK